MCFQNGSLYVFTTHACVYSMHSIHIAQTCYPEILQGQCFNKKSKNPESGNQTHNYLVEVTVLHFKPSSNIINKGCFFFNQK